jgi:chromosome segregation protein
MSPARTRVGELTERLHDMQLEHARLAQLAEQSGRQAARLNEDLVEIAHQTEELLAAKEEAEARFETQDATLAEHQSRYADEEMAGEALHEQSERARHDLREVERVLRESEYAERALQTRIADLRRTLQLAADQARRAGAELDGLQGELFELDVSAAQAGLQDALELRAEREEALKLARIELDNLAALLRGSD